MFHSFLLRDFAGADAAAATTVVVVVVDKCAQFSIFKQTYMRLRHTSTQNMNIGKERDRVRERESVLFCMCARAHRAF